jgi:hypothetical protein
MTVLLAWLSDLGVRLDDHEPDARQLAHIAAVREARRQAARESSWLTRAIQRLDVRTNRAATAPVACACAA